MFDQLAYATTVIIAPVSKNMLIFTFKLTMEIIINVIPTVDSVDVTCAHVHVTNVCVTWYCR